MREQLAALTEAARQHPDDPVPLLKLAHLYAQIWQKNGQAEILTRAVGCLERAVGLGKEQYAPQTLKLVDALRRSCEAAGASEAVGRLDALHAKLTPAEDQPAEGRSEETTDQAAEEPAAEPMSEASGAVADAVEANIPVADHSPPEAGEESEFSPADELAEAEEAPDEDGSTGEDEFQPAMDMALEIETEEEPVPERVPAEEPLADGASKPEHPGRQGVMHDLASAHAEALHEAAELFREGRLRDIIATYASSSSIRQKRYIIEGLAARIDKWRVEPLLAVGALERDERIFKHILRTLLQMDRNALADQIRMENYSPDLQLTAIAVLSELRLARLVPQLTRALAHVDPRIRQTAAQGLGRLGSAAAKAAPDLLQLVCKDPKEDVRHEAVAALNALKVKEAYEILENATHKYRFDETIYKVLDEMRQRYNPSVFSGNSRSGKKPSGMSEEQKQKMKKMVIGGVVLVVLLVVLWQMGYLGGGN